ncbi:unnamed protein product [Neisseria lactamica Y92-1009]|nr:unnamed protein product [Neisseria lactamica Y92-1009]
MGQAQDKFPAGQIQQDILVGHPTDGGEGDGVAREKIKYLVRLAAGSGKAYNFID